VFKKETMKEDDLKSFHNEIQILKDMDHPNILRMYESFEDDKRLYIVTDVCKGGELFDEIQHKGIFCE
jgi:calcium-dependent protein kinase